MTKTDNKNELDLLAQEIFVLQQKDVRSHAEENLLYNKKCTLCKKIFCTIFKDETQQIKQDYLLFREKAFEEIIKNYSPTDEKSLIERITDRYKLKCLGKRSKSFEEENVAEAELRKIEIRRALRKIAIEHGMPSQRINAELKKFNPLNSKCVHEFLSLNFGFSPEELEGFDNTVFNLRYTLQFSSPGKESDSAQSLAEIESAVENEDIKALEEITLLDAVLDITFDAASKEGKTWPRNLRGYWSIRFIELDRPEKWAREKEKHIILHFFLQNRHFYDEYEERIFKAHEDDYEKLTEAETKKHNKRLHKKVHDELHKELMSKMSIELKLQPSRWYDCYLDVFNHIVKRARHELHL